ncbi:MAG: magnesium-protoporphyrin IX monomethyl ester (oxidative) cyclase [Phycisphaerae bacterium]|nr:magnesium-protoporphyrin IX monomethyl ester (oxidative) cyclase [Gemmatimonadaceae bacterium]
MYPSQTALPIDPSSAELPRAREVNEVTRAAQQDAALSPRFYTTDFAALDKMDVTPVRAMWDELVAEFRRDPNKDHFKRNAEFDADFSGMDPKLRQQFIDFLVSSVTAEFSGCILYAEIKKRVKNPDVRELFGVMSRDEGRHAGFINHTLKDFNVAVDLSFLTKAKKYTYFQPKFIFYATYLSEKIGYARYITIYRHLQANPQYQFHPIFKWFENWCQDEFRHGEAFAMLMRANPEILKGRNKLWIRFFLLAVFATMYVRDHVRHEFYEAMGFSVDDYDQRVIKLTSQITAQVFPVSLPVDNPAFWSRMQSIAANTDALTKARERGGLMGKLQAGQLLASNAYQLLRLYTMRVTQNAYRPDPRMAPVW